VTTAFTAVRTAEHDSARVSDPDVPTTNVPSGPPRRGRVRQGRPRPSLRTCGRGGKRDAIDRIREELVLQELGRESLEQRFAVGRWHCTMHSFDRATCIHYTEGEFSVALVSVDSGADVDL